MALCRVCKFWQSAALLFVLPPCETLVAWLHSFPDGQEKAVLVSEWSSVVLLFEG